MTKSVRGPLAVLLLAVASAGAAELSLARFDVRDGLPHSDVTCMRQDRRGFLWVGTAEGLARFDGARFTTYGRAEGLVASAIYEVYEDRRGRIWVGTNSGGIAWLEEGPPARFHVRRLGSDRQANVVTTIREGADGALWCLTFDGLYRVSADADGDTRCMRPARFTGWWMVAVEDGGGTPWFLSDRELIRAEGIEPRVLPSPVPRALGVPWSSARIAPGRFVVAGNGWCGELRLPSSGAPTFHQRPWPLPGGTAAVDMVVEGDSVWAATSRGLVRAADGMVELLAEGQGLPGERVTALALDREGDLWIGTRFHGLLRRPRVPLVTYGPLSGLGEPAVARVAVALDGTVLAATERHGMYAIGRDRATLVPGSDMPLFRRVQRAFLEDSRGLLWVSAADGVRVMPATPRVLHGGLPLADVSGWPAETPAYGDIHEAADGSVWLSEYPSDRPWHCTVGGVPAAGPARFTFRCEPIGQGLAPPPGGRAIASDSGGRVWLSTHSGLWRAARGRVVAIEPRAGWPDPERNVMAVFVDHRGRLWIGTRNAGAAVTSDVDADRPAFRWWSGADGLSSDAVWSIAEDGAGRIYLGTGRGLDIIGADGTTLTHVRSVDGLPSDYVASVAASHDGRVVVGTSAGVAVLDVATPVTAAPPPPVLIDRVLAAGELVPAGGEPMDLGPGRIGLRIEFLAIALSGTGAVRYQHRLAADDRWSEPSEARFVEFPRLPPGRYRFEVRAVNGHGAASASAASLGFTVRAPLWRRPWLVSLGAMLVVAGALAWHRARLRRAVAVERLRHQIATDLHDDIGSGLSQIAVLSEVAKRRADGGRGELDQVADLARTLRAAMGDIVWAIDMRHDHLSDLVQRMRKTATQLVEAEGVELLFDVDPDVVTRRVGVGPGQRRHLLLLFKEAVHNAARHSGATRIEVELHGEGPRLAMNIRDNGHGFDPAAATGGNGLASMRHRAAELSAELSIESRPGAGTSIQLRWQRRT